MDYDALKLPKVYMRNGRESYLDPIRQKLIYVTPEETVRQKVISYLVYELQVPKEMIVVEDHLSHYGVKSNRRADIVILQQSGETFSPVAVIECKAPLVSLSERERTQVLDYCNTIGSPYAMLFNGYDAICYGYDPKRDSYRFIDRLPSYNEMLDGEYVSIEIGELPNRIPHDEISSYLKEQFKEFDGDFSNSDISPMSPFPIAKAAFNLFEGFLDTRIKIPTGHYALFDIIEDMGVRMLSYGNASGGSFYGPYRSILIDVQGSTEIVSFNITTYWKGLAPNNVKTCLAVAIDNEKTTHHALQLVLDDNLVVLGNSCKFYHNGRIAIGKMGSGKLDELREFVDGRYPSIIHGKQYFLGALEDDHLWTLQDSDVVKLVENLISYALIRDEYRVYVKDTKTI